MYIKTKSEWNFLKNLADWKDVHVYLPKYLRRENLENESNRLQQNAVQNSGSSRPEQRPEEISLLLNFESERKLDNHKNIIHSQDVFSSKSDKIKLLTWLICRWCHNISRRTVSWAFYICQLVAYCTNLQTLQVYSILWIYFCIERSYLTFYMS